MQGKERVQEFFLHPEKSLIRMSIPIVFGMGIHIIYSFADMIFVGRLGSDAIAAVTFSGSFFFLMFSLSSVNVGAQALIAKRVGAGDLVGANNAALHALLLGVALGLGFFLGGRSLAVSLLQVVGAHGQVLSMATTYLKILFLGAPFLFFSAFSRAIFIGEGNTKTPVIIMAAATGLNLLLDPIFIFVLGWGVAGAAWATLVAMVTSFAAYVYYMLIRRASIVSMNVRGFHTSGLILWDILKVGVPASLGMLIMSLGGMCYHRIISVFGSHAVAGYGLGGRVDMAIALPFVGISTALLSLVGMYHGASRGDLIERISRYAFKRTLLAAVVMGCLVFVFAEPILHVFTNEPDVIAVGKNFLRYIVFAYPMIAFCMNAGRILQGLGLGLPSLVITATRVLLVGVPLSYLSTRIWGMGLPSIWISILISGCVATLSSFIWLRASLKSTVKRSRN